MEGLHQPDVGLTRLSDACSRIYLFGDGALKVMDRHGEARHVGDYIRHLRVQRTVCPVVSHESGTHDGLVGLIAELNNFAHQNAVRSDIRNECVIVFCRHVLFHEL